MSEEAAYAAPDSMEAAVALLAQAGADARPLAGGTDLIVQMKTGRRRPGLVLDLKRIPELGRIEIRDDEIRIGPALCCAALGEHAELRALLPGLVEAAELIGSDQIQGRASIGGNLCNASPAADTVPALIACGARAVIAGSDGTREVPVAAFNRGPGENGLGPGELLADLRVPRPSAGTADAYLRFIPRTEMDIAVAGAAVQLRLEEGRCTAARVAVGAVAPTALEVPDAAAALVGSAPDDAAFDAAAAAARAVARPIDDQRGTAAYRTHVVGVLVKRAARLAAERAAAR